MAGKLENKFHRFGLSVTNDVAVSLHSELARRYDEVRLKKVKKALYPGGWAHFTILKNDVEYDLMFDVSLQSKVMVRVSVSWGKRHPINEDIAYRYEDFFFQDEKTIAKDVSMMVENLIDRISYTERW